MKPYVPGYQPELKDDIIKLNTNENPYGPSPQVLKAMAGQVDDSLRLYPDPNSDVVKEAVADHFCIKPGRVFIGNGSDEVLAHTFRAYVVQNLVDHQCYVLHVL